MSIIKVGEGNDYGHPAPEKMKVTLDRFKGDTAVLLVRDDERIKFNMPIALITKGSREGMFWIS